VSAAILQLDLDCEEAWKRRPTNTDFDVELRKAGTEKIPHFSGSLLFPDFLSSPFNARMLF
jgi:hypothetical protein